MPSAKPRTKRLNILLTDVSILICTPRKSKPVYRLRLGTGITYAELMHRIVDRFLDFFFPQYCENCRLPSGPDAICAICRAQIPKASSPLCPICGLPFRSPGEDHLCGRCLIRLPHFTMARACTTYGDADNGDTPVTRLVHRFKYGLDVTLAPTLGKLIADCNPIPRSHDFIVPVPLHRDRLRWRGFNQALLLARPLARRHGIQINPFVLVRTRSTPPQVGLDHRERRYNIAGAFAVRNPGAVQGKSILLVDDVYTTGSTVEECAKVLCSSGARRVDVLVLARAVLS